MIMSTAVMHAMYLAVQISHSVYNITTDVRDEYNRTPLHHACWKGNIEVVQYLTQNLKCDVGEFNRHMIRRIYFRLLTVHSTTPLQGPYKLVYN